MQSKNFILTLCILSLTLLSACGQQENAPIPPKNTEAIIEQTQPNPVEEIQPATAPRGTGTTTQISDEDQVLMTEMLRARRKGDNKRADEIEALLSAKYPTLRFAGTASSPEKITPPPAPSSSPEKITLSPAPSSTGTSSSGTITTASGNASASGTIVGN